MIVTKSYKSKFYNFVSTSDNNGPLYIVDNGGPEGASLEGELGEWVAWSKNGISLLLVMGSGVD